MFLFGTGVGIVAFAETEPLFTSFWNNSGSLGRVTLSDWLGVSTGLVVAGVVVMAIGAFWFAEWAEKRFAVESTEDAA
jgi:hypothetical protein